jgi:tRNA threonylcarbamoyladenosine biosynthesis protein TsaE
LARPGAGEGGGPDPSLAICTQTADETRRFGESLGAELRRSAGVDAAPATLALAGPLGAGKTCLVQGLALGLGVSGTVRSPTFTLIHEHRGPIPLFHVDLYRLEAADLEGLGLEEIIDSPGVTAIEWAERAAALLPRDHLMIEFRFGPAASERCLRLIPRGARYERLVAALRGCGSSR